MKALKQVLFVKPAKLQTCGLPKMDQKLLGGKQLRNTRARAAPAGGCDNTSILDRDGEEVTEPEQVVEVFRQHYETLGQSPTFDEGHSQHVAQAITQWASDEGQRVNAKHDGAFTAKEIEEAVKDLPTYKAGDSDELVSLSKQVALRWKRYSCSYSTVDWRSHAHSLVPGS
jgi:hypothetical protein